MTKLVIAVSATLAMAAGVAAHACDCPAAVTSAVEKAHSSAKTLGCTQEREDGANVYEAKVRTSDGKELELLVGSDGAILETEEKIPAAELPAAVLQALHTKHADATVKKAERLTDGNGEVSFEIAFVSGGRHEELTVTEAGAFIEDDDDGDETDAAGNDHEDD